MPTKKRLFTRNKQTLKQPYRRQIGNKSGKARESIRLAELAQDKKINKVESPNYSLNLTESSKRLKFYLFAGFSWQRAAIIVFFLVLFGLSFWQAVSLAQNVLSLQDVLAQRTDLSSELSLWENISQKYPNYRDAYFQAAVLAYQLGDSDKEKLNIDKTLQLDPAFQPAQKLENTTKQ